MEKGDSRQEDKKFLIPSLSSIISWWLGNLVRTGFLFSHKGPIYFHIFFPVSYFLKDLKFSPMFIIFQVQQSLKTSVNTVVSCTQL